MNKITKAQRDQIIATSMGCVILIVGLYYGVITGQQTKIRQSKDKATSMREKVSKAAHLVNRKAEIKGTLDDQSLTLSDKEAAMAPERDTYSWMLSTVKPLLLNHRGVSITISQPEAVTDMNMLPHFFYKSATFHVRGVGSFHDLGSFLADFENGFPHFRIQGIELQPSSISTFGSEETSAAAGSQGSQNLEFRFDIVVPVKPSESAQPTK